MAPDLTRAQKAAGREFREECSARLLALDPSAARCTPYTVWFRHECLPSDRAVQAGTWAMALKQHYWLSADGLFAFMFRQGECPRCGLHVLSGTGRFAVAPDHPPEKGAVVAYPHRAVPAS